MIKLIFLLHFSKGKLLQPLDLGCMKFASACSSLQTKFWLWRTLLELFVWKKLKYKYFECGSDLLGSFKKKPRWNFKTCSDFQVISSSSFHFCWYFLLLPTFTKHLITNSICTTFYNFEECFNECCLNKVFHSKFPSKSSVSSFLLLLIILSS